MAYDKNQDGHGHPQLGVKMSSADARIYIAAVDLYGVMHRAAVDWQHDLFRVTGFVFRVKLET